MPVKRQRQRTTSNVLQSYEACMKQGLPSDKIYASDFTDEQQIQRYSSPPYPWRHNPIRSNTNINQKAMSTRKAKTTATRKTQMRSIKKQRTKRLQ
jgi:hypothetical protein